MLSTTQMRTVKGVGIGEEDVIGELLRYRRGTRLCGSKAKIALVEAEECDFDLLFEVSQEFLGFVCVGEYDKNIAEMAEELRLIGIFSEDERGLSSSLNEKAILMPKKSRVFLAPDINTLRAFEESTLAVEDEQHWEGQKRESFFVRGKKKKEKKKIKNI